MEHSHDLHHSHSKLIKRLDEVDAHVEALANCEDCHLIHRELQAYARSFYDTLVAHIEHEETELFPSVEGADRVTLLHLQLQHLEMVKCAAMLKRRIAEMKEDLFFGEIDVTCLAELVDTIRAEMRGHSAGEAAFLRGEAYEPAHARELI
jgi:predicted DsbA family dithiol-disulfide isomerase